MSFLADVQFQTAIYRTFASALKAFRHLSVHGVRITGVTITIQFRTSEEKTLGTIRDTITTNESGRLTHSRAKFDGEGHATSVGNLSEKNGSGKEGKRR